MQPETMENLACELAWHCFQTLDARDLAALALVSHKINGFAIPLLYRDLVLVPRQQLVQPASGRKRALASRQHILQCYEGLRRDPKRARNTKCLELGQITKCPLLAERMTYPDDSMAQIMRSDPAADELWDDFDRIMFSPYTEEAQNSLLLRNLPSVECLRLSIIPASPALGCFDFWDDAPDTCALPQEGTLAARKSFNDWLSGPMSPFHPGCMRNLRTVRLDGGQSGTIIEGAFDQYLAARSPCSNQRQILLSLLRHPHIRELRVSNWDVRSGRHSFPADLRGSSAIQSLVIENCASTSTSIAFLVSACTKLETLLVDSDLDDCAIRGFPSTFEPLSSAILEHSKTLINFALDAQPYFGTQRTPDGSLRSYQYPGLSSISEALASSPSMRCLALVEPAFGGWEALQPVEPRALPQDLQHLELILGDYAWKWRKPLDLSMAFANLCIPETVESLSLWWVTQRLEDVSTQCGKLLPQFTFDANPEIHRRGGRLMRGLRGLRREKCNVESTHISWPWTDY